MGKRGRFWRVEGVRRGSGTAREEELFGAKDGALRTKPEVLLRLSVEHLRLWGWGMRPSSEHAAFPEGGSARTGRRERRRLGGLAQVTEEARDGLGFLDEGDELHACLTGGARFDVEGEGALEELAHGM